MHLPAGIKGGRTHASTSFLRVSAGMLVSRKQWRLALSKLETFFEVGKHDRTGLGCELLYRSSDDAMPLTWERNTW